ncbi:hypothetical protein [Celeribacter sp. SCSIO 80788]|uniref:hypothetical protein n=1 Tax=Celeribacter sp. SCSIO 80788 TaxID=3117013 RepID=UPI003DA573A1
MTSEPYPGTDSILKRQVDIMEALAEYVSFVATPRQVAEFELDATRLHPTLLRDSILEATITKHSSTRHATEQRRLIHSIYARKTKEMAALYPLIFSTENAYRAALTNYYHSYFGAEDWWKKLEAWYLKEGLRGQRLEFINGKRLGVKFATTLLRVFDKLAADPDNFTSLRRQENKGRFFYHLAFGQLSFFFDDDWSNASSIFSNQIVLGQRISKTSTLENLEKVRLVRNEVFHSNPVKNTSNFVRAAEALLLALDLNLGRFDQDLRSAQYQRPNFGDTATGNIPPL